MIVAAIGTAAVGQIDDGALLVVIFATSGALEAIATKRTADSVTGLLDLAPDRAVVIDGHERGVATTELQHKLPSSRYVSLMSEALHERSVYI